MVRSVPEWIGETDDEAPPPRVRERSLREHEFRCWRPECRRPIVAGRPWQLDHKQALVNGGQNRESNLGPLCEFCMPVKNAGDVAIKAKTSHMTKAVFQIDKPKRPPMPGSRASRFKRTLDGRTVRRW